MRPSRCLGLRDARSRTAHLFCELAVRLKRVGLVSNGSFELPLTQTDIADALGVSGSVGDALSGEKVSTVALMGRFDQ